MSDPQPARNAERKETLADDLNFVTGQLSTLVRQLTFGVLAVVWALLLKDDDYRVLTWGPRFLLALAGLAVLTLTLDVLQYLSGYFATRHAYAEVEAGRSGKLQREWWSYRLRGWCFLAKIATCLLMVALFLGQVLRLALGA